MENTILRDIGEEIIAKLKELNEKLNKILINKEVNKDGRDE